MYMCMYCNDLTWYVGYSGKVDHLLMPQPGPSGPEVEHSFSSDPLHNIICVSIQCINNDGCGLK